MVFGLPQTAARRGRAATAPAVLEIRMRKWLDECPSTLNLGGTFSIWVRHCHRVVITSVGWYTGKTVKLKP